jgi:predicted O-methyltransferase YrrM
MSTLKTPRVATVLARMFREADAADEPLRREFAARTEEERAAFRARANSDYRGFYAQLKDRALPVSPETGALLYMLARSANARVIVEFGTSFGISALHLAAALSDNGGGRLIGTEFEPSKAARARANLAEAGLAEFVEIREGDALETLARDLPARIDLVLLDGAKVLYPRILALLESHLPPRAIVVGDNVDQCPELLARLRSEGSGYLSVPFGADVEVSMRL